MGARSARVGEALESLPVVTLLSPHGQNRLAAFRAYESASPAVVGGDIVFRRPDIVEIYRLFRPVLKNPDAERYDEIRR